MGVRVKPEAEIASSNLRIRGAWQLRRQNLLKAPDGRIPELDIVIIPVEADDAVAWADEADVAEHVVEQRGEVEIDDVAGVPQQREDSPVGGVAAAADHHHLGFGQA